MGACRPWPHSPWVQLVQGAIHPNSDRQLVHTSVLPHLLHHSSQASSAELGCAQGHGLAHLPHQHAVLKAGIDLQFVQDGPDLSQGQAIAVQTNALLAAESPSPSLSPSPCLYHIM